MKILLLLISLILCVLAQTPPTPPLYPTPSHALQLSICQSVSVFCPPGFNNNTIASQTYYDYDNNRSSAQDTNSLIHQVITILIKLLFLKMKIPSPPAFIGLLLEIIPFNVSRLLFLVVYLLQQCY